MNDDHCSVPFDPETSRAVLTLAPETPTPTTPAIGADMGAAPAGADTPRAAARRAVEGIWRIEASRVVAAAMRLVRDFDTAEDLAQEALIAAVETWSKRGIPDRPGAWLVTTVRRRALDWLRHRRTAAAKAGPLGFELDLRHETASDAHTARIEADRDDPLGDELLALMFTACHPLLAPEGRAALTLRTVGGLTTEEIARAYLTPVPTVAQRIVRAKRTLTAARVPFEVPRGAELKARLASVLEVLYLMFNEGYSATAGRDWMRPALAEEALRLGRVLAGRMPRESEVQGLVALMELQDSRFPARLAPDGEPILLLDQDRGRWDRLLIRRGLAALARAERLPGPLGPYALQAAIAACHARATSASETDWPRIAALYDALAATAPSPVVTLNRAVAVAMAFGPAAGLAIADALTGDPALARYHLLPAVRGDLLLRLGRDEEAKNELERAAALTRNDRERTLLLQRTAACRSASR